MKEESQKKNQVNNNEFDLIDWFLAIDGCIA
jgi:hypothetical protein